MLSRIRRILCRCSFKGRPDRAGSWYIPCPYTSCPASTISAIKFGNSSAVMTSTQNERYPPVLLGDPASSSPKHVSTDNHRYTLYFYVFDVHTQLESKRVSLPVHVNPPNGSNISFRRFDRIVYMPGSNLACATLRFANSWSALRNHPPGRDTDSTTFPIHHFAI